MRKEKRVEFEEIEARLEEIEGAATKVQFEVSCLILKKLCILDNVFSILGMVGGGVGDGEERELVL